ncbi:MAG TPA: hypothetical protein VL400_26960 [Polyangiaceae bacterium]|jgi:hypothetical protein|nr:hypothetical protein [Polyangiaceae bacterium]
MKSIGKTFAFAALVLFPVACGSSRAPEPSTDLPADAATAEPTGAAAVAAAEPSAIALPTTSAASAPSTSSVTPSSSASAAPAPMSEAEKAEATKHDLEMGRLAHHPYALEIAEIVTPAVCKAFGQGWSGDGILVVKNGKIVSFEAGTSTSDAKGNEKWHGKKMPELKGKAVPPIPPELAPLFAKGEVDLDAGCM